jgi:hypothetical protein
MKIEFTSIIPKKDKWGQPVLGIVKYKENEAKMREDMMWDAAEMLEASGIKNVKPMIIILEWQFTKWEQLGWEMILKHQS